MFIIFFAWFFNELSTAVLSNRYGNRSKISIHSDVDCYTNVTSDSFDLMLYKDPFHSSDDDNAKSSNLIDFIFECFSNSDDPAREAGNIISLHLSHLCVTVNFMDLQPLQSLRRLRFYNCSVHFETMKDLNISDLYPRNLSRWSFDQSRTNSFSHFIRMINALGPFKLDLTLSGCFDSIYSFNDFSPLKTPFILLNITCSKFHLSRPSNSLTRLAIFLTPILIINTESAECPPIETYEWLGVQRGSSMASSIRTLTCKDRLIQLHFSINQTIIQTTLGNSTQHYITTSVTIGTKFQSTLHSSTVESERWKESWSIFNIIILSLIIIGNSLAIIFILYYVRRIGCRKQSGKTKEQNS